MKLIAAAFLCLLCQDLLDLIDCFLFVDNLCLLGAHRECFDFSEVTIEISIPPLRCIAISLKVRVF